MRYSLVKEGRESPEMIAKVDSLVDEERHMGLHSAVTFTHLIERVDAIGLELVTLLRDLKRSGKKVVGYGATSKSTTVNNYFGIGPDLIDCIYDITPTKIGRVTPGKHIPVLDYSNFHASSPDYVLLYAWNHGLEIKDKEQIYMRDISAKWITYIPEVSVSE